METSYFSFGKSIRVVLQMASVICDIKDFRIIKEYVYLFFAE